MARRIVRIHSGVALPRRVVVALTALVCAIVGPVAASRPAAALAAYVVNSTSDSGDRAVGDGVCLAWSGGCTLRAALQEARIDGDASTISFDIAGAGPHTIQLGFELPRIDDVFPTTINGYTQPGSSPNTAEYGSNAQINIEIRGTGLQGVDAFAIYSDGNVLRGVSIYNTKFAVKLRESADDNRIHGNFIGTNAAGTFGAATFEPLAIGVSINDGSDRNRIGTANLADRNVISGNGGRGIATFWASNDNVIQNNVVGLSPTGARRANLGHGIDLNFGSSNNLVGGLGPFEGNVVSGNRITGVEVSHGANTRDNSVIGNWIGTTLDGSAATSATKNLYHGIHLEDRARFTTVVGNVVAGNDTGGVWIERTSNNNVLRDNFIGVLRDGTPAPNQADTGYGIKIDNGAFRNQIGPGNVIANQFRGVWLVDAETIENTITRNRIVDITKPGIDIVPSGVSNPNDLGDIDVGPNTMLNYPVLASLGPTTVAATACAGCVVEVFAADGAPGQFGDGDTYLASATADILGDATVVIPGGYSGAVITATATDPTGNTSEFSRNVVVP
jgi:parallel beta-helix repeat protein